MSTRRRGVLARVGLRVAGVVGERHGHETDTSAAVPAEWSRSRRRTAAGHRSGNAAACAELVGDELDAATQVAPFGPASVIEACQNRFLIVEDSE